MRHYALTAMLLLSTAAHGALTEEGAARRVYAHLLVKDPASAVQEAKTSLGVFPHSKALQVALVRSLCEKGDETEAWEQWRLCAEHFPEVQKDRRMLEVIAWGALNRGEHSSQMAIRLNALLGAAFTRDARAVPLLIKELRSSNAVSRSVAVRLATAFGDTPLQDEMLRMLATEKVWYVRLELLQAVGSLKMVQAKGVLSEIISHPKTMAEEKMAAILALVHMYDGITLQELKGLARSNRAGLRQLACHLVMHLDFVLGLQEIVSLLKDPSPEVRISALNTLGVLRVTQVGKTSLASLIEERLDDASPDVQITAAWVALLQGDKRGEQVLEKWILSSEEKMRRLASGAVGASGKYGIHLAEQMLKKSEDVYVRVTLALGLIGQRHRVPEAGSVLYQALLGEETLWMWDRQINPLFRSLGPSQERHIEQIPHYPLVADQMVRLDLLSALSIIRHPNAEEAVRTFLKRQTWGVTGAAAAVLLQEGDELSFGIVRGLLEDPEEKVRVQAALILALLGSDPAAVRVLQQAYPSVDRGMKVHILEALAHVGDPESIPFLVELLKEPFQILRVVAASALIQCLYH